MVLVEYFPRLTELGNFPRILELLPHTLIVQMYVLLSSILAVFKLEISCLQYIYSTNIVLV